MIHKEQICGCHEIREQCDQETGQTQIRSGDRRKVIIIRLFHHIKDRGGQDHGRRGIVHQDHQIAFQHLAAAVSGRSVYLNFGNGLYHFRWYRHSARLS